MYFAGNKDLLSQRPLAVYCSREIPLSVYDPALELVERLVTEPLTLAGGWHSRLEKEALKLREPGSASNIIYFLAKGIQNFKLPHFLRSDLDRGKVLIISPWMRGQRVDRPKVDRRNTLILEKIHRFLFLSLKEGGNLEELFYRCLSQEREVWIFDHPENRRWDNPRVNLASLHHHPAVHT